MTKIKLNKFIEYSFDIHENLHDKVFKIMQEKELDLNYREMFEALLLYGIYAFEHNDKDLDEFLEAVQSLKKNWP